MSKKIMDLIPEPLHEQLRTEVIEDLKQKGWHISQAPESKKKADLDKEIQEWGKSKPEINNGQ